MDGIPLGFTYATPRYLTPHHQVYMPWISMNGRKHRERYHERRRQWRTELSHCSYRLSYYCEVLQNPGGGRCFVVVSLYIVRWNALQM